MASFNRKKKGFAASQQQQEMPFARQEQMLNSTYIQVLRNTDASDPSNWKYIVTKAIEGGLSKEVLCKELHYDWSTFSRWKAGRNAPPTFTRQALKLEFIKLLESHRSRFVAAAGQL